MASIYELTTEFQTLWNLMEEGVLDDEMLEGAFDCTKEELAIKLEGYCKFIKNLESDIGGLKAEEDRLRARRKTMENTIERAKAAMLRALQASGENKIPCGTFTVSAQFNPPKVVLDEQYIENIPERWLTPQEPTINRKAMLEALKAGENLEGIAHLEREQGLRIK